MTQYRLSNRQQKELLIRGQQIRIAIPVDPESDSSDSGVWYAKQSLPEHAEYVTGTLTQSITVALPPRDVPGTIGTLGDICDARHRPESHQIPVAVEVVIVTLTPPSMRGEMPRVMWPGWVLESEK